LSSRLFGGHGGGYPCVVSRRVSRSGTGRCGRGSPALAVLLAGCAEAPLSTLHPGGPAAAAIADVWWVMLAGSLVVLLLMIGLGLYVALRAPDRRIALSPTAVIVGGGLVFPGVVLAALLVHGARTGEALLPLPTGEDVFRVDVTAHRWWWEVRYPDMPGGPLYAANEIHVPVGLPVDVRVTSDDVIHSFWVPRLGGKIDAIPGRVNTIRLRADEPGVYRGQCAEFCGAQHARMGLRLIAHDAADLGAAVDAPAAGTAADRVPEGAALFARDCAACHAVDARTHVAGGPNLARVTARAALGAETIPNAAAGLRRWLREHRTLKPGNLMSSADRLDDAAVDAIARYLEALP